LGAGTSVTIVLPAAKGHAAVDEAPAPRSYSERGRGGVLVVEDEPDVRRYATATLLGLGYYVTEAPDAETALKVLNKRSGDRAAFHRCRSPEGHQWLGTRPSSAGAPAAAEGSFNLWLPRGGLQTLRTALRSHSSPAEPYKRAQLARAIQRALKSETTTSHVA